MKSGSITIVGPRKVFRDVLFTLARTPGVFELRYETIPKRPGIRIIRYEFRATNARSRR